MNYIKKIFTAFFSKKCTNPIISIIIPCYNSEKYLSELLTSVTSQSIKELQIICINDGSNDNTINIIHNFMRFDKRIELYNQKNSGAGAARNNGLRHAIGEYISILDSDDVLNNNMYEEMLSVIGDKNIDITICRASGFDQKKHSKINIDWSLNTAFINGNKKIFSHADLNDRIFNFSVGWTWDKLFRRDFLKKNSIQFQELRRADDLFFVFYSIILAKNITIVDQYLINHRYHSESMSANRNKAMFDFYTAINKLHTEIIKLKYYNSNIEKSFIYWMSRYTVWQYNSFKDRNKKIIRGFLRNTVFKKYDILSDKNIVYCDHIALETLKEILWDHDIVKPLITIAISGYNVSKYISSSIESVINQTYENIEILCIDDGSTDNTLTIMKEYADKDPRIKVHSFSKNTPGGVGTAANWAINNAQGEFLAFCDGDDWMSLTAIEELLQIALAEQSDFVYAKNTQFNEKQKKYLPHYDNSLWNECLAKKNISDYEFKILISIMGSEPWKKLYRTNFLISNNLRFPVGDFFFEDSPFHIMCILLSKKISLCHNNIYFYRINRIGSTTMALNNERLKIFEHLNFLFIWMHKNMLYEKYKNILLLKALKSYDFIVRGTDKSSYIILFKLTNKFFSKFDNNSIINLSNYIKNEKIIPLVTAAKNDRLDNFFIILNNNQ